MTEQDKQALIEYYCQRDCGHTREECCLDNCHEIMLIEEFPITPTDIDTISRQAAIDALKKQREELLKGLDKNSNVCGIISASTGIMICTVGQLPSAQPTFDARDTQYNLPIGTDLISRAAAIDALGEKPLAWEQGEYEEGLQTQWESDVEAIKALPSAQPERKKGKWIEYEQEFMLEEPFKTVQKTVRECPVCTAKIAGMVGIMNYCPNCGAKMEVTE